MQIGLPSLLTLLFVGLKLTNHIAWSWIWVLSPLWISTLLVIVLLLVAGTAVTKVSKEYKNW